MVYFDLNSTLWEEYHRNGLNFYNESTPSIIFECVPGGLAVFFPLPPFSIRRASSLVDDSVKMNCRNSQFLYAVPNAVLKVANQRKKNFEVTFSTNHDLEKKTSSPQ
jgi:hypothetical protein